MEEERFLYQMPQMCPYMQQNPYIMQGMYSQQIEQSMSRQMAYPVEERANQYEENIFSQDDYRRSRKHHFNHGHYSHMHNPYWYGGCQCYNSEHGHYGHHHR